MSTGRIGSSAKRLYDMSILKIRYYPDPILKKKAEKVSCVTDAERAELCDMAETMYLSQGIGLAANQVGIDKQLVVVDVGDGLIKLVNPSISMRHGCDRMEEGCLSVPGAQVKVKRSRKVVVRCLNEEGKPLSLEASGLLARAIQHEADHLVGKTILDHLNPIQRLFLKNRLTKDD